jgi:hypothetical protein
MKRVSRCQTPMLAAIICGGIILRLWGLNSGLWFDEAEIWRIAQKPLV